MKILFLTHSFNSLTQRLYVELTRMGHDISVEFDVNDSVSREAVALYEPDLILATFLKRAIPADIWQQHKCLIVHPGPPGDRGPSSLDWAIQEKASEWGVTVLQAEAEMDAGPVWGSETFSMRSATKSSLYRHEVTEAALKAVRQALERIKSGTYKPQRIAGNIRPAMRQKDRRINWQTDDTETVLAKIRAADGQPGVLDSVLGMDCYLYNAHREMQLTGPPGTVIAKHNGAICLATIDGAVWIGHLRQYSSEGNTFKLPANLVLGELRSPIPAATTGYEEITYREEGPVGYLDFSFYNGAMTTQQCEALRDAVIAARERPTKVLCLLGGEEFWSNGLNLNVIEACDRPAEASWLNINAIDDLVREIIMTTNKVTVSVMRGNAGAGGVFLALAADRVIALNGIILNPHYKNMGNLYGSEYWTYLLPRRSADGKKIMNRRLPIGAQEAKEAGLVNVVIDSNNLKESLATYVDELACDAENLIRAKQKLRSEDEQTKPLETYREEELANMKLNFFGFDPSYHVARYYFVHKTCHSRTPPYLAKHRCRESYHRDSAARRRQAL